MSDVESRRRPGIADRLLRPDFGPWTFGLALLLMYGGVPAVVYLTILPEPSFLLLALITLAGVVAMWVGSLLPVMDGRLRSDSNWVWVEWKSFTVAVWLLFGAFVLVTFLTAPTVPLLSALQGASADALSVERGEFLKGRSGPGVILLYLSAILTNTVVPYSIVIAYAAGSRARHLLAVLFFIFCVSFLVKALFLHLVLPLMAFFALRGRMSGGRALLGFTFIVAVLTAATFLSLGSPELIGASEQVDAAELLSAAFAPANPVEYVLWRALAVPVFTATDTLFVHATMFDARNLMGATSTLIASVFGLERINLERFVFEYQFGGWNDLANSNTTFLVDGYVNFGWFGVIAFGLFTGQVLRWFRFSKDEGFRALWLLFAYVLFNSPLIGFLLSSGFVYMLLHAGTVRLRGVERAA